MTENQAPETTLVTTETPQQEILSVSDAEAYQEVSVIASDATQVQNTNRVLVERMDFLLGECEKRLKDLNENMLIAKKNHWRRHPLVNAIGVEQRKIKTYEKLREAFKEGYVLVPDMSIDIFAIRTTRKNPSKNKTSGEYRWDAPVVRDQESNSPKLGEGRYVSEEAIHGQTSKPVEGKEGVKHITRWAEYFRNDLDFPFLLAKPKIANATQIALSKKIFDSVGVSPFRYRRRVDPMVIGRIRHGYRNFDFLIGWFVPLSSLTL